MLWQYMDREPAPDPDPLLTQVRLNVAEASGSTQGNRFCRAGDPEESEDSRDIPNGFCSETVFMIRSDQDGIIATPKSYRTMREQERLLQFHRMQLHLCHQLADALDHISLTHNMELHSVLAWL